jgi:hypothetical protein
VVEKSLKSLQVGQHVADVEVADRVDLYGVEVGGKLPDDQFFQPRHPLG